jgi:hypothetical protein
VITAPRWTHPLPRAAWCRNGATSARLIVGLLSSAVGHPRETSVPGAPTVAS